MGKNQRSLKNYLINPSYQLKYILYNSLLGFILTCLYAYVFYVHINENYSILIDLSDMTTETRELLYRELKNIITILIISSVAFLCAAAIVGVVISHKVAGPMFKLESTMREMIENKDFKRRVKFRPGDEFQSIANTFNKLLDKVQAEDSKKGSNNSDA